MSKLAWHLMQKKLLRCCVTYIKRNVKKMGDGSWLRESGLYQMIVQEGRENALHQAIVDLVQARFSELKDLATQQVATTRNVAHLHSFLVKVGVASNAQEAENLLLDLPKEASQDQ